MLSVTFCGFLHCYKKYRDVNVTVNSSHPGTQAKPVRRSSLTDVEELQPGPTGGKSIPALETWVLTGSSRTNME
ncbi:unnamed protein product [Lota lota]